MFVAAIAFTYTFTHKEYMYVGRKRFLEGTEENNDEEEGDLSENNNERQPFIYAFLQSAIPDDVFADVRRATSSRIEAFSPLKHHPGRDVETAVEGS